MQNSTRSKTANRVTWISIFWEALLIILKATAGLIGRSSAMLADALHSFSDLASDIILLISFRFVNKPRDETHHYGHGKFETLSAILISLMIFAAAATIFWNGFDKIIRSVQGELIPRPGWIAAGAAVFSIGIKEYLYQLTARTGEKIRSTALKANAWHHRSDAVSSVAALLGIIGARTLGAEWRILDPIAAVFVGIFIVKVALNIARESLDELLEASLDDRMNSRILEITGSIEGAENPHNLKTRKIGSTVSIDMHIKVSPSLSIVEAHDIATQVEDALRNEFGDETFISVHMEPQLS